MSQLLDGIYDGEMTIGELLSHGNFGVGTFNGLDGEMVVLDGVCYQVRHDGSVSLPDLRPPNRQRREMAERAALNAPIQGSAADIVKIAMMDVATALSEADLTSRLLVQIHDELLLEIAPGEEEAVEALVREKMAWPVTLSVPLDVAVGIGASWQLAAH